MREIYTYANPLLMNKDDLIWGMLNKYPQFCASDTLSQGMIQFYGRKEFGIIQTMSDLQKALVGSVTNNSQFDMQLFLDVSHEVRERDIDPEVKKSFRNDLSEIVQAIRYLLFLDAVPEKLLNIDDISVEQKELFKIYRSIYLKYEVEIEKLMNRDRKEIVAAIRSTVIKEAEYVIRINKDDIEDKDYHCKDLTQAREKLCNIRKTQKKKIEERQGVEYTNTSKEKKKLERVEYAINLIDRLDSVDVGTIIIHGVHKFTPEILMTLRLLEKQGINVIFLIHYVDKLPQVYGTWREVYSWTQADFKNVHSFDINAGSATGREIARIYSGGLSSEKLNSYQTSYSNLSDFALGEVRQTFSQASEQLSRMKVQYYAVNNADTNEILKSYFPEQFEVKPFLSYPIGQFILGLYNMWDFENSHMKIIPEALRECVVSGVFENQTLNNISEIYDDISLYIADLDDVEEMLNRLEHLKNERSFIDRNKGILGGLKAICYFSRDVNDINKFIQYIQLLDELSKRIFAKEEGQISFNSHFRNLMEVLSGPFNNAEFVHKAEIQLAQEILGVLGDRNGKEVIGDFSDVKEALTFFLHQSKADDSSNWIVRNFEQLDGAVLLADKTKAREYHFALMSMKNMTRKAKDELPWPLSEEIFYEYDCELESSIQACALSNKERANFLKFSLFYASFFFKKRITFSYIENQNDEKQRAYYLFDLLKLKEATREENADVNFVNPSIESKKKDFNYNSLTVDQKEIFAICKYKFFLNRVLRERIVYSSDFQIKYFLQNYIIQVVMESDNLTTQNQGSRVKGYVDRFRKMFPNYDSIVFSDIERKVIKEVSSSLAYSIRNHRSYKQSDQYKRRKNNFLLAQWNENGANEMDFSNVSSSAVVEYMLDDDILLSVETRPHAKVCENCNFSADCLMSYFEGLRGERN